MVPPYVQYCFISAEVDCRSELDLFYDLIISLLYTVFNICIRILYYVFNFALFLSHTDSLVQYKNHYKWVILPHKKRDKQINF